MKQKLGFNATKLFFSSALMGRNYKLECFFLGHIISLLYYFQVCLGASHLECSTLDLTFLLSNVRQGVKNTRAYFFIYHCWPMEENQP
jgi:hypothetical protein